MFRKFPKMSKTRKCTSANSRFQFETCEGLHILLNFSYMNETFTIMLASCLFYELIQLTLIPWKCGLIVWLLFSFQDWSQSGAEDDRWRDAAIHDCLRNGRKSRSYHKMYLKSFEYKLNLFFTQYTIRMDNIFRNGQKYPVDIFF